MAQVRMSPVCACSLRSAGHDYGESSCTPPGKPVGLLASLKCLHSNARSMGNKQDELEICVRLQGYNLIAIKETWWDSSRDWNAVMEGCVVL